MEGGKGFLKEFVHLGGVVALVEEDSLADEFAHGGSGVLVVGGHEARLYGCGVELELGVGETGLGAVAGVGDGVDDFKLENYKCNTTKYDIPVAI